MSRCVIAITAQDRLSLELLRDHLVQQIAGLYFDGPPEPVRMNNGHAARQWKIYGDIVINVDGITGKTSRV
jgi:hypothetical protein